MAKSTRVFTFTWTLSNSVVDDLKGDDPHTVRSPIFSTDHLRWKMAIRKKVSDEDKQIYYRVYLSSMNLYPVSVECFVHVLEVNKSFELSFEKLDFTITDSLTSTEVKYLYTNSLEYARPSATILCHLRLNPKRYDNTVEFFRKTLDTQLYDRVNLQPYREHSELQDFTLVAEGSDIRVNKYVVAKLSSTLRKEISRALKEKRDYCIVEDVSYDQMLDILEYLHCGTLPNMGAKARELFRVADVLQLGELRRVCERCLREALTLDNCEALLRFAVYNGAEFLKAEAEKMLGKMKI